MRLVTGLLALTLTGSLAYADEASEPKAPELQATRADRSRGKVALKVVRMLPETQQALLFDKNRGTHVLAEVGSVIGTYTVMEIGDDEVTLSSSGRELVLAAPDAAVPAKKAPAAETKSATPADPYPSLAPPVPGGPDDPYAPDTEIRTVEAPKTAARDGAHINSYDDAALNAAITSGAGSVRVAPAPDAVTVTEMEHDPYAEPAPAPPAETDADPYEEPAPAAKPAKKPPAENEGMRAFVDADPATMVSRKELNAALGDFAGLTASMRGAFTPAGARIDVVAPGTVFAKAGLRNGDVITAVDGLPIKSIDDAADLYIRAASIKTAKVELLRAGKPMTLRLAIQ